MANGYRFEMKPTGDARVVPKDQAAPESHTCIIENLRAGRYIQISPLRGGAIEVLGSDIGTSAGRRPR